MNNFDQKLQALDVPAASLEAHQAPIKQAVFAAGISEHKTNWSILMTKKKFIVSAAALALALVVGVGAMIAGGQSAKAYADQSLQNFSRLSPAARQNLDVRINGNADEALKAAEQAKNLKVLTYAQFQQLLPGVQTIAVQGPNNGPGPSTLNPGSLKYLVYTDSQGTTHVVGVDKQGLPALIMVYNIDGNADQSTVQVQGKDSGGASTQTNGSAAGSGQSMQTSCAQAAGGKVTCTSSDGGTTTTSPDCQTLSNGAVTCSNPADGATAPPAQPDN